MSHPFLSYLFQNCDRPWLIFICPASQVTLAGFSQSVQGFRLARRDVFFRLDSAQKITLEVELRASFAEAASFYIHPELGLRQLAPAGHGGPPGNVCGDGLGQPHSHVDMIFKKSPSEGF